ncbi:MAG: hypothetical protein LBT00_14115, partial [Spirochaetaceae bacterium]|nr:hypothetical protein [Spirochaetaceae bacterium]
FRNAGILPVLIPFFPFPLFGLFVLFYHVPYQYATPFVRDPRYLNGSRPKEAHYAACYQPSDKLSP